MIKNVSEGLFRNIQSPVPVSDCDLFFLKRKCQKERRWRSDGTREDTTILVQIEEVKCTIRTLSFVTKLSPVGTHNSYGDGWGTSLTSYSCPDCCGKRQESPVQLSRDLKTELECLKETLKRLTSNTLNLLSRMKKIQTIHQMSYRSWWWSSRSEFA